MDAHTTNSDANADDSNPVSPQTEPILFEPFPKLRLFPDHWDLSEFQEKARPNGASCAPSYVHEPFPELRTFPSGWCLE